MKHYKIKLYHDCVASKEKFYNFLLSYQESCKYQKISFSLNYDGGETYFGVSMDETYYESFSSLFYSYFRDYQIIPDGDVPKIETLNYAVGYISLKNNGFFPFKSSSEFIEKILRSFEFLSPHDDVVSYSVDIVPLSTESMILSLRLKLQYFFLRLTLLLTSLRYILSPKMKQGWKSEGKKYFTGKLQKDIFSIQISVKLFSQNTASSKQKLGLITKNFSIFTYFPFSEFRFKYHPLKPQSFPKNILMSAREMSDILYFPEDIRSETSLLKQHAKKIALASSVPHFAKLQDIETSAHISALGISNFRNNHISVGIYDDDRLKHMYVVGKTGSGKSKFLTGLMIEDIKKGKGLAVIDPHGDLIEELLLHIPQERREDVIIFDPSDTEYPFCFNPLDLGPYESPQILAKGFIDIFKKFFGNNWNPRLEHVLRMLILALLDKKDATLYDIIKALTDKDFRYEMIEEIRDDVVRNFWTQEFAAWSQQFNNEAIMPILNKVGQLLSVDILKNIFAQKDNKLDMRSCMDEQKILLIKLSKGLLQEDIMGFLGAMCITKIYQGAMSRQALHKSQRKNFYLYVDEFQNFTTETFGEILSESRKYGLGLCVAHQYLKQIPQKLSDAIFGNIGNMICFRVSSEDARELEKHFDGTISSYDLAHLGKREMYVKILVDGEMKDTFSLQSVYLPDKTHDTQVIESIYALSRKKYTRELKKLSQTRHKTHAPHPQQESFEAPIL